MSPHLDTADRLLIDLLTRDARTSTRELAAYVGETPENCLDRIHRLSASGHLAGYRAVRGFPDPDEQPMVVLMFVERLASMSGRDVLRSLRGVPEVISWDVADERFDLIVRIQLTSGPRVEEIATFFRQQAGVRDVLVVRTVSSTSR